MKLIKLDAIDSTNSFLKELCKNSSLENYTVVVTNNQTNGRGQVDTNWHSEPFKNLTFSILINKLDLDINESKYINFAASLAVYDVLKMNKIENLFIKWPNDIMADSKKICGILIENTFQGKKIKNTIIGIGLNINQTNFFSLKNVTSLKKETKREFNVDELLYKIIQQIKSKIDLLNSKKNRELEEQYLQVLYRKNILTNFIDNNNQLFSGKIIGISKSGNLEIELKNNSIKIFGIKEVSFA